MSEDAVQIMVRTANNMAGQLCLADRLSFITSLLTTVMANDKARALYEGDAAASMTVDMALTLQVGLLNRIIGVESHDKMVDALRQEFGADSQFLDVADMDVVSVRKGH